MQTPDGSSLAETDRALRFVEEKLKAMPEVASYFTNIGHGNPKIYYNQFPPESETNYGDVFVKLNGYDTRETPQLLDGLRDHLKNYPNARIYCEGIPERPADHGAHRDSRRRARSRAARIGSRTRSRNS